MIDIDTKRNVWVTSPLPDGRLVVEEMSGSERLGQIFGYELSLISKDPNVDFSKLLGERMTVHVALPGGERTFNGVVTRAQHLGEHERHTRYQISLRPWLWLLSYTSNCRIFQNKSVPDIVKQIFRENGRSDFSEVLGEYKPMEFCVQYRESDFNFVSRLMEQEGIYFYFEHEADKHILVMTDGYDGHAPNPGYEEVPYHPPQEHGTMERESLSSWATTQQIRSGSFSTTDYDFMNPRADLVSRLNAAKEHSNAEGAVFDYPGHFLTKKASEARVKMRLEEKQVDYELAEASGDVRGLSVGSLFKLIDSPRETQNKEYLIVAAHYQIHAGEFISGAGGGTEEFHGSYTLLDSSVQFRPALQSRKPVVEGPQTAVVVGEKDQEIWTDKYGRVKVQFHWDRYGNGDENSSCFVRVSQVWAGAKWGAMHIPRIGQEVIVDFLEGDPDRPIITGRVYNDDNKPPYDLPDNQTQSGIKSRSTPKGGPNNFNEIRFEDKKDHEELFIQAEKNQTNKVKHNQSVSVGADRSVSVGGNESISVTGTRTSTITKKETQTFKNAREMTVTKTDTVTITGLHTGTYKGGRTETVDKGDTLTVNASDKTTTVHGEYNVTADKQFQITQGANTVLVKNAVDVNSEGEIHLHNPKCSVDLKDGKVVITAAEEITLECGSASISLKKDGTIEINGSQKVQATGGGSGMELVAAGATMSGTKTTVSGTAMAEITGAIVKIN